MLPEGGKIPPADVLNVAPHEDGVAMVGSNPAVCILSFVLPAAWRPKCLLSRVADDRFTAVIALLN
jgi:hypothetical protein